jgi:hypothetical protein
VGESLRRRVVETTREQGNEETCRRDDERTRERGDVSSKRRADEGTSGRVVVVRTIVLVRMGRTIAVWPVSRRELQVKSVV